MINSDEAIGKWAERPSAGGGLIRQADVMFELLFERSSDAIWLLDPQTAQCFDCNQAALELMRMESKADVLRAVSSVLPAAVLQGCSPRMEAAISARATPNGCRFEWSVRRCDGTEVPLEVLATPISDSGKPVYVLGCRDITERKQAEEEIRKLNQSLECRITERTAALAASEAHLRTILEHAPEAIVVFDANTGCFRYGNQNAARLYGYTLPELVRLGPADVSPDFQPCGRRSAELAREKLQEAYSGGTPVFEWIHKHSSGRLIPTEVRLVRLPAEGESLVLASVIDNSDHHRREKVQQATYEISEAVHTTGDLDSLFRRIHHIVKGLMPAENFYLALYNPETELLSFPYHVDEVTPRPAPCSLGTGLTGYVFRLGKPLLVDQTMNSRKRKENNTVTFEGYEGIRYVESGVAAAIWLGVPLSTGGKPFGVLAVQDYHNPEAYGETEKQLLTFVAVQVALAIERKRAQQALRDSEGKLLIALAREKELGQLRSNFVSMVSHEFRTPLGVILSSADILDSYFDQLEPGERREQLVSIQKNTRRMSMLMEEVLLLGIAEAGKLDFKPVPLDLEQFSRRLIEDVLSATNRKCPIELHLPEFTEPAVGDERLLRHIFSNLLSNAVKYSPAPGAVEFQIARDGHEAVCQVRDRGLGIPEQDVEWLFSAFHRGRNVGHVPGTGIGLTIVKRCLELHGGQIHVESKVGSGTTVTVRLPLFAAATRMETGTQVDRSHL